MPMESYILGNEVGITVTNSKEGPIVVLWRNNTNNIDSYRDYKNYRGDIAQTNW